jgi:hypothetical protein
VRSLIGLLVLAGCGAIPERGAEEHVDALRELVVVDEQLLSDARAASAVDSAWTFPSAVAHALSSGADVRGVLEASVLPPPVLCAWLHARGQNSCTPSCEVCVERILSPEAAPLRLIAVVYRPDLGLAPEGIISPGESRLIFAATSGPADDPGSAELAATIALEYHLEGAAAEWARTWHALGQASTAEAALQLATIVARFAERRDGRSPRLARVRANDGLGGPGVLREWVLDGAGRSFVPNRLPNTPHLGVARESLEHFALEYRDEVLIGRHQLPEEWRAASTDTLTPPPALQLDDPALVRAFGVAACNGCHGSLAPNLGGFHVAPGLVGAARLSEFLLDPEGRSRDELSRRADALRSMVRP